MPDDNNKNNPPGEGLFAGLNARPSLTPAPAAAPEPDAAPDTAALEEPIPFSTDGLPAGMTVVKAVQPGWDPDTDRPEREPEVVTLPEFQLGQDSGRLPLPTLAHLRAAALEVLRQSTREVLLLTPDLETARFDNEDFVNALSAFARSSRHTVTRILVGDPADAVREGHKMVSLIRRLSSRIEIRRLHEEDFEREEAWLLADMHALLRCTDRSPWQGSLIPREPTAGRRLRDQFQLWWERAEPVPDFRDLKI